jgi:hypothetical protein
MQPIDELFAYPQLSCVCDPTPPQICNTGVMVIEPRAGAFAEMDDLGRVRAVRRGIGDQSSINALFRRFTPVPAVYNAQKSLELGLGEFFSRRTVKVRKKNTHRRGRIMLLFLDTPASIRSVEGPIIISKNIRPRVDRLHSRVPVRFKSS